MKEMTHNLQRSYEKGRREHVCRGSTNRALYLKRPCLNPETPTQMREDNANKIIAQSTNLGPLRSKSNASSNANRCSNTILIPSNLKDLKRSFKKNMKQTRMFSPQEHHGRRNVLVSYKSRKVD